MKNLISFICCLPFGICCHTAFALSTGIGGIGGGGIEGPATGFTCRDGQICCFYNDNGGCMRCAAPGGCPTCSCPTECPDKEWSAPDRQTPGVRCNQVQAALVLEPCKCEYRCSSGYYLNGKKCSLCPSTTSIASTGATVLIPGKSESPYNDGDITSCYIAASTSISDEKGTYQFTSDCHYTP